MSLSLDKKEETFQETGQQQLVNLCLVCGCLYHDFIIMFNILSTIIYKHRFPRLFGSLTSKTKSSQNSSIFFGDHHHFPLLNIVFYFRKSYSLVSGFDYRGNFDSDNSAAVCFVGLFHQQQ